MRNYSTFLFLVFLRQTNGSMAEMSPLQELHVNSPSKEYSLTYYSFRDSYEKSLELNSAAELNPGGFSFFTQHNLRTGYINPQLKSVKDTDWITAMLLVVILLLTFMRFQSGRKLTFLFRAVFSSNDAT